MARGAHSLSARADPDAGGGFTEPPVPWLTILVGAVARAPAELAMLGDAERCVTMGARSWLRPC